MKLHIFKNRAFSGVFGALLIIVLSLAFSSTASAHGYVNKPESRGLLCKTGANKNCGGVQYEPQSLEALGNFPIGGPADGKIAGANTFPKLDEQSKNRWTKVTMKSGANTFSWTLTAPHATAKWDYYITKQNWNPNKPLKRADLERFCTINYGGKKPSKNVKHECNVPKRSGYQVILAVWSIADTPNAFYNVIDANFDGTTNQPIKPNPDSKPEADTNNTKNWSKTKVYVGGDEVTYNGSLYKAKWWTLGEQPGKSTVWEMVKQNGEGTSNSSLNKWSASKVYLGGDKVEYNGKYYKAKWWTRGEQPGKSVVWEMVKQNSEGTSDSSSNKWNASKVYLGGDKVEYNGKYYKAKWWTRGEQPDISIVWELQAKSREISLHCGDI